MNEFNKKIFAQNLQYYMDKKGIDRNQLSEDTDSGYSTVCEWLQAKKFPRIDKIEELANYFKIPKSYLIEEYKAKRIEMHGDIEKLPENSVPAAHAYIKGLLKDTGNK